MALPAEPVASSGERLETIEVTGSRIGGEGEASPVEDKGKVGTTSVDRKRSAQAGLLTAGDYDDLLNPQLYARYAQKYLQNHPHRNLPFIDTRVPVKVRVVGRNGEPIPFAEVSIADGEGSQRRLFTAASGLAVFFPSLDRLPEHLEIGVTAAGAAPVQRSVAIAQLPDDRIFSIQLPVGGHAPNALDLLLTIDTTGSMTDELAYLQTELDSILASLRRDSPDLDLRVGLIVYRDQGDDYVTRSFAFTHHVSSLRKDLGAQSAIGGGDYPEAVEQAFAEANRFDWRPDAVKAMLHVADAPPHDNRMGAAWGHALALRSRGVHIVPVAASGVADDAQYLMRSAAAVTQSRYLFLTDDSGVGLPHQEPDVPCYVVTRLDRLIERVLASLVTGRRVEPPADAILRTTGDYERGLCLPVPTGSERPEIAHPR